MCETTNPYDRYLKESDIPLRYQNYTKMNIVTTRADVNKSLSLLKQYRRYLPHNVKRGCNLYIYSYNPGTGKTTYACNLLLHFMHLVRGISLSYQPAYFVSVPNVLELLKENITSHQHDSKIDQINKNIREADIVVFDDIGTKKFSEYDMEMVYTWVDYRTSNNKTCIYTSNIDPRDMPTRVGSRLADRIVGLSNSIRMPVSDNIGSYRTPVELFDQEMEKSVDIIQK